MINLRPLAFAAFTVLGVSLLGCKNEGSCVNSAGGKEHCISAEKAICDGIMGGKHEMKSCADRGYTEKEGDSYVKPK